MQKQVGLTHLVQCALEGIHQIGGQLAYESHCVREQEGQVVHNDLAHRGVECGKELVFGKHLTLGQEVHERTLAHIGIAHECHTNHASAVASLCSLLPVNIGQSLLEQAHAVEDDAPVHLELRLSRTTQAHRTLASTRAASASLSLKMGPHALQAR